jgi:hypothetical protein
VDITTKFLEKSGEKKIMVVGIEKKPRGISRWYGRIVETASQVNLGGFMRDHIREVMQKS